MTSPVYGTDMVSGRAAGGLRVPWPTAPPPVPFFPDGGHWDVRRGPGQVPSHVLQPARQGRGQLGPLLHGCVCGARGWGRRGSQALGSPTPPPPPPPGLLHHKGDKTSFSSRFGQGSIIGVHLDTWHGTLTFFKNRKCIGEQRPVCTRRAQLPRGSLRGRPRVPRPGQGWQAAQHP